ncbi:MAG: hypothetical protein DWH79_06410 [Planctomycetota bacterium]|nr:MAG: hypothetical protein DWH79_06410 [Planctomycetota bacterium]
MHESGINMPPTTGRWMEQISQRIIQETIAVALKLFCGVVVWSVCLGFVFRGTWSSFLPLTLAVPAAIFLWYSRAVRERLMAEIERTSVMWLFVVGLALRVAWAVSSGWQPISDGLDYDRMAMNILNGQWGLDTYKPIGTSYFLALHYAIFGHLYVPPMMSQSLLSALQIPLVYSIVLRASSDRRAALMAAALLTFCLEHLLYVDVLGSDTLFSVLVLAAVWLASQKQEASFGCQFIAGGLLGLSQWVRPTAPIFLAAMAIGMLARTGQPIAFSRRLLSVAFVMAGAVVPMGAIVALNLSTLGVPSLSPSQMGGASMMIGTNIATAGTWSAEDASLYHDEICQKEVPAGVAPAIYRNQLTKEVALKRIAADPIAFTAIALSRKMQSLWGEPAALSWPLSTPRIVRLFKYQWIAAGANFQYAVCALLMVSAALRVKSVVVGRDPALIGLLVAALGSTLAHAFLEVQSRYHFAFVPFMAMVLAIGCCKHPSSPTDVDPNR